MKLIITDWHFPISLSLYLYLHLNINKAISFFYHRSFLIFLYDLVWIHLLSSVKMIFSCIPHFWSFNSRKKMTYSYKDTNWFGVEWRRNLISLLYAAEVQLGLVRSISGWVTVLTIGRDVKLQSSPKLFETKPKISYTLSKKIEENTLPPCPLCNVG